MGNPCPNQVCQKGYVYLSYHKFREELESFLYPGHFPGPLVIRRLTKNMLNWVMGFSGKPGREGPLVF